MKGGHANDIVILVIGLTGAGKSSFINTLLGEGKPKMIVGDSLQSCTVDPCPVDITDDISFASRDHFNGGRLVIVDTPGFDDTYVDDSKILKRTTDWLAASYSKKMKLGGVIYLHDISQSRILDTTCKKLYMFQKLVRKDALRSIVLGTTKWSLVDKDTASKREQELKASYWSEMINAGSPVFRVDEGRKSAWEIINFILSEIDKQVGIDGSLKMQHELGKNLRAMVKHDDPILKDGNANDIVIPVMGPTGAGKSSFINALLGEESKTKLIVGHSLKSCTPHLQPVIMTDVVSMSRHDQLKDGRLIIVDTPGFDDTYVDDSEILRRISVWLAASYSQKMKLGGVIYLHDITQNRMLGMTRRNLDMFQKLVGKDALKSVVIGTTKWSLVQHEIASKREHEFKSTYWAEMIQTGSPVFRVDEGRKSAWDIVNFILTEINKQAGVERFLKIQHELVKMKKIIPETDAGKTLKYTLDQLIEMQEQSREGRRALAEISNDEETRKWFEEGEEKLRQIVHMAKEMRVPLSRRLKKFFDKA
ncbi:P-loop containing nucleoside triphosphate hydrolase protein [Flammula alnicola]|nr:P-loop containing nucleoside triphosphate hydrolase protein [Flammula alnicola]